MKMSKEEELKKEVKLRDKTITLLIADLKHLEKDLKHFPLVKEDLQRVKNLLRWANE